jgi:hypothetical protein
MPNKLLTSTLVTREILRIVHNNLAYTKGINRSYDKVFAEAGAKIGATANVRLPNQYYLSDGPDLQAQATQEQTVPVTINHQWHVDVNFTTADLTLSLDDFSKRILSPMGNRLTSGIDYYGLNAALYGCYNFVGTPGVLPGTVGVGAFGLYSTTTSPAVFLNAGAALSSLAVPTDNNRRIVLSPNAQANSVQGLSGLFEAREVIAEQYRKGVLGYALGFEFATDQNINTLTTGAHGGSPVVNGANQTGTSLYTSGWPASTQVLMPGEIFQIGAGATGCYSVNPENQQSNGNLQNFVVGGWSMQIQNNAPVQVLTPVTSDASGNATIPITPSIIPSGAQQAYGTVVASPVGGAVITPISGAANSSYPQSLAYHNDFATLACVDLELPSDVAFGGREVIDGISLRIVRQYLIGSDQIPARVDVLGGWAILRPSFGCRISS